MWIITVCIVISILTSTMVTKILATHYFEIVEGYVDEMCKRQKNLSIVSYTNRAKSHHE